MPIISFAIIFILVVIIIYLAAFFVDKLITAISLGFINRVIGAVFGLIMNAFILSAILAVLLSIDKHRSFLPKDDIAESHLFKPVSKIAPLVFPSLHFESIKIPSIKDEFKKKEE